MRFSSCNLFPVIALLALGCGRPENIRPQAKGTLANNSPTLSVASGDEVDRSVGKETDQTPKLDAASTRKFALLVGVTKYDRLKGRDLIGPGNDVTLMRDTLKKKPFVFPEKNIVTLAEASGSAGRPTRANIKREFDRLANLAAPGDQIMILMCGHGSQQPERIPLSEPDGLDETFLPCDAGPWNSDKEAVTNAIIDDELEVWTKAITDKGASLFIVFDSCHSGTLLRGGNEVAREIPEGELVPLDVLKKARERAAARGEATRGETKTPHVKKGPQIARLVGLYAAQSHEPTIERPMPPESSGVTRYGLLTYTVCHVLTQAQTPLNYRELRQRVQAKYIQWNTGSLWPTPLIEGASLDDEVLGTRTWPGRSRFTLKRAGEEWKIEAGLLHGLTEGSILAVYPVAGKANDKLVGHVRIKKSQVVEAEVEPCEYAKKPVTKDLPDGARCELVYVDCGSLRLKVGMEEAGKDEKDEHRLLRKTLKEIAKGADSPMRFAEDASQMEVVARVKGEQVYLMAADVAQLEGKPPLGTAYFGPYALQQADKIKAALSRIARVRNLLRIAADPAASLGTELKVEMVKLKDKTDNKGETMVPSSQGTVLKPGEWFAWRVTNESQSPVDVTFLFITSDFGIQAVFPNPKVATSGDNRILPGKNTLIARGFVDAIPVGREHMVVIAVKGAGEPIDFTCLSQPTLERAEVIPRGTGKSSLASPLGQLMKNAIFAEGATRGFNLVEAENQLLRVFSWTVATTRKKE